MTNRIFLKIGGSVEAGAEGHFAITILALLTLAALVAAVVTYNLTWQHFPTAMFWFLMNFAKVLL